MYHRFTDGSEPAGRFVVPIRRFERQLSWLRRAGYTVLGLDEYVRNRGTGAPLPARSVAITIDDGLEDTYRLAYPVLRRLGVRATVFVVSRSLGGLCDWTESAQLRGRPVVSWDAVREMSRSGIDIGAHTRTHPALTTLDANGQRAEISGSREDLEQNLRRPVTLFAYPYGAFDAAVAAAVEAAGFSAACTVLPGVNAASTPLYALRRIEIRGTFSMARFGLAVEAGGPWLTRVRTRGGRLRPPIA
jgi:peptidoglycan/xylan/chitin deacetylase (PgdA/CDA1 family)